jgi:F-type H+-transporting ATPase subunit delta
MTVARDYAKALFMLTEELGTTEEVKDDVTVCRKVFLENPSYLTLTDTPALALSEKLSLVDEAFSGIDTSVCNLIKILCEKHSVHLFPELAKEYLAFYNEARGICTAEVISAVPLSESQLESIKAKLRSMTGKTVVLNNKIDNEVLGGIKLRYMGIQLDGSLKSRLDSIEKGLKNTIL